MVDSQEDGNDVETDENKDGGDLENNFKYVFIFIAHTSML